MRPAPARPAGSGAAASGMAASGMAASGPAVLGDAVRDRARLAVACEACGHQADLDPARLAGRVGYDCPVPDLRARMRCSRCGSRRIAVQVRYAGPGVITRAD